MTGPHDSHVDEAVKLSGGYGAVHAECPNCGYENEFTFILFENEDKEPQDAHVVLAHKIFRDCGFTLLAMQFKRPPEALIALKRFNGLADDAKVPFSWNYHPNEWCARKWKETGQLT